MNVSFSGLKNASCAFIVNETPYKIEKNGKSIEVPKAKDIVLNVQLDNTGENDLDNFKDILKKYPSKYAPDHISFTYEQQEFSPDDIRSEYYLNGTRLKINDENLRIFSKLAQLTEKLNDASSIKQEPNYTATETFDQVYYSILMKFLKYTPNFNHSEVLKYALNPGYVANAAKHMQNQIYKDMNDYFA